MAAQCGHGWVVTAASITSSLFLSILTGPLSLLVLTRHSNPIHAEGAASDTMKITVIKYVWSSEVVFNNKNSLLDKATTDTVSHEA